MEKGKVKGAPSLSVEDETSASVKHDYTAPEVADAFLKQYYTILQNSPKDAHKFYHNESIRALQCADGSMKSVTTLENIDREILVSNIKEWNPNLSTMHAQESIMNSVIVGLTGSFTDTDDVTRNFSETFYLAQQASGGFYVHNHFLNFIDVNNISESSPSLADAATPLSAQQANEKANESSLETAQDLKKNQTDKSTSKKDVADIVNKVADSSKGRNLLPSEPEKKVEPSAWQPPKNILESSKRISYASIVAKEVSVISAAQASPSAVVAPTSSVLSAPKSSVPATPKSSILGAPKSYVLAATNPSVLPVKASALPYNGPSENIYDVKAIRVKDLPPKTTQESLLEVVKTFGAVKLKDIQIKEYAQDGYRYAFVEFDNSKSARNAVEARFIQLEDRECEIQYKKTSNQGGYNNHMGRPQAGRGGFRNDNSWYHDGEEYNSGSCGRRHNEHENSGQYYGQNRDHGYNRHKRYFEDQGQARRFT
uniref:nuclear transport factor 2-like n=1 Tax=Erigeron canadensis TaxID=72917 RepID=UPI001CB925DD|nr:nuclear transport factor 2-like [Erigeron canadensis]